MAGNRPNYNITVFDKNNPDYKGNIGVAWIDQANGSITIKLNRCVNLSERDGFIIKMWPIDYSQSNRKAPVQAPTNQAPASHDAEPTDDDIPF